MLYNLVYLYLMKLWKFLFLLPFFSFGQTQLHNNVDDFIGVDVFENYYFVKNNTLYKSNIENNYQNINYGKPNLIDISNPLQILVFYKYFNKVVLLDNQLNLILEFDVPIGIKLLANAGKDKIWMYNELSMSLELYTIKTQKTEVKSLPNIKNVKKLKADLNKAYILNTNGNLEIYNFLARKIESKKTSDLLLPISLNSEYFCKDYKILKNNASVATLPQTATSFEVVNKHCYFFDGKAIYRMSVSKK